MLTELLFLITREDPSLCSHLCRGAWGRRTRDLAQAPEEETALRIRMKNSRLLLSVLPLPLNTLHVGWLVQVTPGYPGSCVTAALCGSQRGVAFPVAGEPGEGRLFHGAHGILTAVQSRGEPQPLCV